MKYFKMLFIYNVLLLLLCGCTHNTDKKTETPKPTEEPYNTANPTLKDNRAKSQIGIWYSVWYRNEDGRDIVTSGMRRTYIISRYYLTEHTEGMIPWMMI